MNIRRQRSPFLIIGAAVVCVISAALSCAADSAHAADAPCEQPSSLHQRIVARADQGIDSLRAIAWMTKNIYGIGMDDIAQSLDLWRAAGCTVQLASAAPQRH